jgi:hypothetical protein
MHAALKIRAVKAKHSRCETSRERSSSSCVKGESPLRDKKSQPFTRADISVVGYFQNLV